MSTQQLIMYTDKRLQPVPFTPGDFMAPPLKGMVFAKVSDPVDSGNYYKWTLELAFDGEASSEVQNNFFRYGIGWDHIFSPYKGDKPDGMYFFFAIWLYFWSADGGATNTNIYIGRGKSGSQNPWWAGNGGFTVSDDHKSATFTFSGNFFCTNAKTIECTTGGNVGEIDFYINKYITS